MPSAKASSAESSKLQERLLTSAPSSQVTSLSFLPSAAAVPRPIRTCAWNVPISVWLVFP